LLDFAGKDAMSRAPVVGVVVLSLTKFHHTPTPMIGFHEGATQFIFAAVKYFSDFFLLFDRVFFYAAEGARGLLLGKVQSNMETEKTIEYDVLA
jgi:hypothetical protein